MTKSTLNKLQNDFLKAFFKQDSSFYLTGGAALAGFYLYHRKTDDLDLFTLENDIEKGFKIVQDSARDLTATVEAIQTAPDFRRMLIKRDNEGIVVDLVREYVFQVDTEKREINGIRVDSPEEILANKLCALLSRSEIRDLVDVFELENAGFDLEKALSAAAKKDSGLTPAQLAWVLNQIELREELSLPGDISVSKLKDYLDGLIEKLKRLALPKT